MVPVFSCNINQTLKRMGALILLSREMGPYYYSTIPMQNLHPQPLMASERMDDQYEFELKASECDRGVGNGG